MGTVIRNASLSLSNDDDSISSLRNAASAINKCLEESGTQKEDVAYLVNIGLYNDKNLYEPSYASLIQMKSGINLDPDLSDAGSKRTFSFDLTNGSCGFLNAVQVLDTFLSANERAIIISSNNHPSEEKDIYFPFCRIGSAVLIEKKSNGKGFRNFFHDSDNNNCGISSYVDIYNHGPDGRKNISFTIPENYHDTLAEFTVKKLNEYIAANSIDTSKTKLFMSQPSEEFLRTVIDKTGFPEASVLKIYEEYGDAHSSIVGLLFSKAKANGFIRAGDILLVVAAGSGLTVAISTYEV
jgi:3-oxoacyl-[acyl-carrier-protein] synthase III